MQRASSSCRSVVYLQEFVPSLLGACELNPPHLVYPTQHTGRDTQEGSQQPGPRSSSFGFHPRPEPPSSSLLLLRAAGPCAAHPLYPACRAIRWAPRRQHRADALSQASNKLSRRRCFPTTKAIATSHHCPCRSRFPPPPLFAARRRATSNTLETRPLLPSSPPLSHSSSSSSSFFHPQEDIRPTR